MPKTQYNINVSTNDDICVVTIELPVRAMARDKKISLITNDIISILEEDYQIKVLRVLEQSNTVSNYSKITSKGSWTFLIASNKQKQTIPSASLNIPIKGEEPRDLYNDTEVTDNKEIKNTKKGKGGVDVGR